MKVSDGDDFYRILEAICPECWKIYNDVLSKIFFRHDAARCGRHDCFLCGKPTIHMGERVVNKKKENK